MNGFAPPPPITDRLAVALRAFAGPRWRELREPATRVRRTSRLPSSPWTIIFDTETTVDAAQALRFGTYQVRENDRLHEAGIFYDPAGVSDEEREILRAYAVTNELRFISHAEFVEDIFYGIGYDLHANIVGFNLPFDISRIAIGHNSARGKMRGGFTFRLSPHAWTPPNRARPNVQIKHISARSAFIQFASAGQPLSGAGQRRKRPASTRRGHFIDVRTLAGALFAGSFSLKTLGVFLKVEHPKLDFTEFLGAVTDEMVGYAVRDVQTTWECYQKTKERYASFGLTSTGPNRIYSEAGIGKAYLKDMGVQPWRKMQPLFPYAMLGKIMGSYYGGRSEVRIRRELRQVMLCDFLSMYPTVCILMKLWNFVIGQEMTWRDSTEETRAFLSQINRSELQSKETWSQLATLVRVKASNDIFPVRAEYQPKQSTIAVNYLTSLTPMWYTLADCIASKLLTGRPPDIVEAISFAAGSRQEGLRSIQICGNADYIVDPNLDDFYARLIALRQATKMARDAVKAGVAWTELDINQAALKIAANATSYGIFMEVNVEDHDDRRAVAVHSATDAPFHFEAKKTENPGPYFHPLIGTLITGAARLMLAITERLIAGIGLDWAFCDTDSMAIAKPDAMSPEAFHPKVQAVVDWFSPLNPHGQGSILKIEEVNYGSGTKDFVPLFVWAISAKRYALFNLSPNRQPVIRKASAHGLGHLSPPYDARVPAHGILRPSNDLTTIGVEHWQHDLWWQIVSAALEGHPDRVDRGYHPALKSPEISRYGASTPELLRWFKGYNATRKYHDQVKPFGFLSRLAVSRLLGSDNLVSSAKTSGRKNKHVKPIAPFDRDPLIAATRAFDRETGEPVVADQLRSYEQALAQYHLHPEAKFQSGNFLDRGMTHRRHIQATHTLHIGKESANWEEQMYLGLMEDRLPAYGLSPDGHGTFVERLQGIAHRIGRKALSERLSISPTRLRPLLKGNPTAVGRSRSKIEPMLVDIEKRQDEADRRRQIEIKKLRSAVTRDGLRATARRIGVDPSNLRRTVRNPNHMERGCE